MANGFKRSLRLIASAKSRTFPQRLPRALRNLRRGYWGEWRGLSAGERGAIVGAAQGLGFTAVYLIGRRLLHLQPSFLDTLPALSIPGLAALQRSRFYWRRRAEVDPLTGMLRREAFEERVRRQQGALRRGKPRAILFGDLDNFKPINDLLGKKIGDRVLAEFASRAAMEMRASDVAARPVVKQPKEGRWGGDEFLFGGAFDRATGEKIAERLRAMTERLHQQIITQLTYRMAGTKSGVKRDRLYRALKYLEKYPLRLSIVARELKPGDSLSNLEGSLDNSLSRIKRERAKERARAI